MLLDLSRIIAVPGGVVPFETSLDLHAMQFGSCCPVTEPVQAKGSVRNTAGVLELTGTVWTTLHGVCVIDAPLPLRVRWNIPSRPCWSPAWNLTSLKTRGFLSLWRIVPILTTS